MFIDSHLLGTGIEWQSGTKTADFGPATKNYAPLICRVVRAVRVLGDGLGLPVGAPSMLNPQLPICTLCSKPYIHFDGNPRVHFPEPHASSFKTY